MKRSNSQQHLYVNSNNPTRNVKSLSTNNIHNNNSKTNPLQTSNKDKLQISMPKNVNQFRQLLNSPLLKETDIDWILRLRSYKKNTNRVQLTSVLYPPNFYEIDLAKYKKKLKHDKTLHNKNLKCNYMNYSHIIKHRNDNLCNSQFIYETSLRNNIHQNSISSYNDKTPWKCLSISPNASHNKFFGTFLPPVLNSSKHNIRKLADMISHPIKKQNETVVKLSDGQNIKQRVYRYDNEQTLRSPSEHYPSSKYKDKYSIKNLNLLRNTLNSTNTNYSSFIRWQCILREYNNNNKTKTNSVINT